MSITTLRIQHVELMTDDSEWQVMSVSVGFFVTEPKYFT